MRQTFSNWRVAPMTPTRVDTPDGGISISWRSNADPSVNDRAEAAAALIAEAPELLEALRLFVKYDAGDHEDGARMMMDYADALAAAKSAIAKATSEREG